MENMNWVTPIITFILGYIVSRFTMTKKENKDHQARLQDLSNKLSSELNNRFQEFSAALKKYIQKNATPDLNDFFDISTKGESYFLQGRTLCDSILSNNVDKKAVKNTHVPVIIDIVEKTLPAYYNALQEIAKKRNIQYDGVLKEENYKSIYEVYRKYKK